MKNTFSSTILKSIRIASSILIVLLLTAPSIKAQDSTKTEDKPAPTADKPVRATFENQVLINNQTVMSPAKKSLDFVIQHRFGVMESFADLGGLYAPSNIRLGLTYGITDRFSVGVGATKLKHLFDLQGKYVILQQTKTSMPVTVSYYGDIARSAMDKSNFLNQDSVYKGAYRFSYFHEIMVARKFNSHISLQAAATFSYFNLVDSGYEHANYGISAVGRYRFSPQSSIIMDFDMPLTTRTEVNTTSSTETSSTATTTTETTSTTYYPKPNLGIGFEVSTSGHQFQIFVCNSDAIINQESRVYNMNSWAKREIMIGFNITRQWGF